MNYAELLDRLYKVNLYGGIKMGLGNCLRLNAALGFPDRGFPSIHVAGTNGKGSVCTKIAKSLEISGKKAGLYTSPHLSCFRERMRVNGSMIPEDAVKRLLPRVFNAADKEGIPATFFEITTMLAFLYFAEENVDAAVLETGLGGRMDATNIVTPLLSIITSISLEHTEVLGPTLESIAREKGGIIKPGVPVIIGPRTPHAILKSIAQDNGSPCIQVEGTYPNFNEENNAIARKALERLNVPSAAIAEGLQILPPCRMEIFLPQHQKGNFPKAVVLDVAHNPDGMLHLFEAVRQRFPNDKFWIVCGLSKNKDIASCCSILNGNGEHFYPVEASNGRGIPAGELAQALIASGIAGDKITMMPSIVESLALAFQDAHAANGVVIVCGTFFIMCPVRAALGLAEPCDPVDMNERMKRVASSQ